MQALKILSGGAAQGLVAALLPEFEAQTGYTIEGEFGAVGAMAATTVIAMAAVRRARRTGRVT